MLIVIVIVFICENVFRQGASSPSGEQSAAGLDPINIPESTGGSGFFKTPTGTVL